MQVGGGKIGHFRQKTRYNSKTVQDRRTNKQVHQWRTDACRRMTPNAGNKFPLARPVTVQNFVTIQLEVSKISAIVNLGYRKMWAKLHQNL